MDLNSILDCVLTHLGGVHPVVAAGLAVLVFWLRTKGWLQVKMPSLPSRPEPTPATPDVPDPLADSPLLKRLRDKLKDIFAARVIDGGEDDDDVYVDMLKRMRDK